jgi:hypothetical protein
MHYGGDGRRSKSIWAHEPILTPERKLWRAVLTQAFDDAEMTPIEGEPVAEPMEASQARCYLRGDSPFEAADLKLVCDFAELPADRVILSARRKYAPEPTLESHVECGGSLALCPEGPPLFFPLQAQASPGCVGLQAEKRELRSRTPQNAATPQAQVRT